MIRHFFESFLSDEKEYGRAERYWRNLWDQVLGAEDQADQWRAPWLSTTFADGTPFRDGNPIFSAVSPARKLGVRVIQHEPTEDRGELEYWIDSFEGEKGAIRELVLSCALSDEVVRRAAELIRSWVARGEVQSSHRGTCHRGASPHRVAGAKPKACPDHADVSDSAISRMLRTPYFPMQNRRKMRSRMSSVTTAPTTLPSSSIAWRRSIATSSSPPPMSRVSEADRSDPPARARLSRQRAAVLAGRSPSAD